MLTYSHGHMFLHLGFFNLRTNLNTCSTIGTYSCTFYPLPLYNILTYILQLADYAVQIFKSASN